MINNLWREHRAGLTALALTIVLLTYEALVLGTPFRSYFHDVVLRQGVFALIVRAAGVGAIVGAQTFCFWASFRADGRWRVLYFIVFAAATFIEFGYIRATGTVTNAGDVSTAAHEFRRWFLIAPLSIDWRAAPPVVLYAATLIPSVKIRPSHDLRRFATAVGIVCLVHSSYAIRGYIRKDAEVAYGELPPPMLSAQAFARSLVFAGWAQVESLVRYQPRNELAYSSRETPTKHVVLVIDESMRGDHLSVNGYERPTTPWLEELQRTHRLTSWGVASSFTSTSAGSIEFLMTGVNVLPDPARRRFSDPTMFQYAKALHYETHLFEVEAIHLREPFSRKDLPWIDDYRGPAAFGGDDVDSDVRAAREVAALLSRANGQFVIVFKRGNHFPYSLNYPPGREVWPAPYIDGESSARPDELVNSYDNAVSYNADAFFRALLDRDGSRSRTVILYTSDHGEALDQIPGRWRTFGWPSFAVPLMMFGDDRPAVDTTYRASHFNVFPTVLDLLGFPEKERPQGLSRSLLVARGTDHDARVVFSGDTSGRDQFRRGDFDEMQRSRR